MTKRKGKPSEDDLEGRIERLEEMVTQLFKVIQWQANGNTWQMIWDEPQRLANQIDHDLESRRGQGR